MPVCALSPRAKRPLRQLRCSEIWGGSQSANLDICTNNIVASVFSISCTGLTGGDVYYFAVCDSNLLTRVVLADLRGHGHEVSELSAWIFEALKASMNSLNGTSILAALNRQFYEKGWEAITTATVVSFYSGDSNLYVANAGHPAVLLRKREEDSWNPIHIESHKGISNVPLGMFRNTAYSQAVVPLSPGDRLALYTDGFTEGVDSQDFEYGEDCLRNALRKYGHLDLAGLKDELVAELHRHVGGPFIHDDVTLLLLEIASERKEHRLAS